MSAPDESVTSKVQAWLNDIGGGGIVNRIDLMHVIEGSPPEMLGVIRVSDDAEPFDVSQEVWDLAVTDAETREVGRMQRYVMLAFRSDEDDPTGQHPFVMNGKLRSDLLGGTTEGSTPQGHMAQLMRHSEKLHTSLMLLTETTSGRLARDLADERKMRMTLEAERHKIFETVQELSDRKHERDMENAREAAKQKRHDELFQLLAGMAPLIASKFLQAPVGLQLPAAGARDEAVHQLLKNLSEEEAMKVFGALKPQNQLILAELYQAHKEKEEESQSSSKDEES